MPTTRPSSTTRRTWLQTSTENRWATLIMDSEIRMRSANVRPNAPCSKARVSAALSQGWARVGGTRKGAMADVMEVDPKTINRALTGENLPELHTAFNSLLFDATALSKVAALYGFCIVPQRSQA